MLSYLRVAAFATIEELSVDFGEGLTVITGETGAGKSLLVDALSFVSGQKPRGLTIRPGSEEGVVEALFTPPGPLPEGFPDLVVPGDDLVIRRVIASNGRIRQTVNGQSLSLSQLQTLLSFLFDLVGQGENIKISQTDIHREYLDSYARMTALSQSFETLRRKILSMKKEQEDLRERFEKSRQDKEHLSRIQEDATLLGGRPMEYEDLSQTLSAQLHVQELATLSSHSYNAIHDDDGNILSRLARIGTDLDHILDLDQTLLPLKKSLQEATEVLKDVAHELRLYQESLEMDPDALFSLESRFNLYRRLAQKYHVRPDDLAEFFLEAGHVPDESLEEERATLDAMIQELERQLREIGRQLTEGRGCARIPMGEGIRDRLKMLRIDQPLFTVLMTPFESDLGGPYGMEKIEFLFSANPGMPEKPLGQVASGGEISRVLLAIKALLSDRDTVPTLVFDEIDSGIGGEVGEVLGDLLKEIGKSRQVIAITHLHQVARKGDAHLLVRKTTQGDRTHSRITKISGEERVREIARMLGGEQLSPSTLTIARELLEH